MVGSIGKGLARRSDDRPTNGGSQTPADLFESDSIVAHRYRVIGYLGDRGFGQVYAAQDSALDRQVVLMRLCREFSRPAARESFYETRSTAAVEDPRIVDLCDYGEDVDGRLFLVMPWVDDAKSLDQMTASAEPLPWPRAKAIAQQIAGALAAAHAKGVLHGGLEPRRVLVDPQDGVHIVDFGLAPVLTEASEQDGTHSGPLPGKIEYLSPEQVRNEAIDERSDIYALGVMVWELVSGRPPFVGDGVVVADAHLAGPIPALTAKVGGAALESLLRRALAKDPSQRVQSAVEFAGLLAAIPDTVVKPMVGPSPSGRLPASPTAPGKPPPSKVLAKPAPTKPVSTKPGSTKPALDHSAPTKPVSTKPVSTKPVSTKPAPTKPALDHSVPTKPPAHSAGPATEPPGPAAAPKPVAAIAGAIPAANPAAIPAPPAAIPAPPAPVAPALQPSGLQVILPQAPEALAHAPVRAQAPVGAVPPPRKRRLGKLELAIIIFLGFDLLLFGAWKLFGSSPNAGEVASVEPTKAPTPEAAAVAAEPEEVEAAVPDPPAEPPAEPREPTEPGPSAAPLTVAEAIASELPQAPEHPGPIRPMSKSISDKVFREAMVAARDSMFDKCLDQKMRRTLKVALKVAPSGKVEYARVVGNLGETSLGQCIAKQVYKIEFPTTFEGGTHTYTLRLR